MLNSSFPSSISHAAARCPDGGARAAHVILNTDNGASEGKEEVVGGGMKKKIASSCALLFHVYIMLVASLYPLTPLVERCMRFLCALSVCRALWIMG